jgi:hypothetical protein
MPTSPSDEPPLIDHDQFLAELDRLEVGVEGTVGQDVHSRAAYGDAFEALESGLPLKGAAPEFGGPHHEAVPAMKPYQAAVVRLAPTQAAVPFLMAALVIVACFTAGAASAVLVFHDQVAQITEARTATR